MGELISSGQNQKPISRNLLKQRINALFLLVLIIQPLFPITAAYAQEQSAKSKASTAIPKKSPVPLTASPLKNQPATDAQSSVQGSTAQFLAKVKGTGNSETLSGPVHKTNVKPHEITSLRTATTSTRVNADGTYTKTEYASPHFYKNDGSWQSIDTSATEDTNAADSGNIFGKALGKIESGFSGTKSYKVTGNTWQARFASSNDGVGMVRLQENGQTVAFSPVNANDVVPQISKDSTGRQIITYKNLWDGITVEYQVESTQLKEFVSLENATVANSYSFKIDGANLIADPKNPGAFKLDGALEKDFEVAPLSVTLMERGVISENVAKQSFKDGKLTVTVDKDWLKNLPKGNFPVVIDPSFTNYLEVNGFGNYTAYKSDGYVCSQASCYVNAGYLNDSGYWKGWRSVFYVSYNALNTSGAVLSNATLHLTQMPSTPGYYYGVYTNQPFYVVHASCGGYNCVDSSAPYGSATFNTSGDIDVTGIYQTLISRGDWGGNLMLIGNEVAASTLKMFDSYNSYVTFTYSVTPAAPAVTTPSKDQVFVDPQVSFKIGAVSNPNGAYPVTYNYRISSSGDGTGVVVNSGNISATQWTVPDGILQDGSTYYFSATATAQDSYGVGTTSPSSVVMPFRIDSRKGNDKTQTADTLGPVSVDLATGNVSTSESTHVTKALGGSIGLNLDYNSPVRSRAGLIGEYWNVGSGTSLLIPSTQADLTRVDQSIDFDWSAGSPSSGTINNDWFEARLSGYFIAPAAGTYYFGGNDDDDMAVYINNSQVYHNSCSTGTCYGSSVSLMAGQVVPIRVEYLEGSGNAAAHLYVKGAVSEQVVPSTWLQTGVRPVEQQQGLIGHYYNDDGTHNLDSSSKVQFLSRTDPLLSFNWGSGSPVPGGATDFMARWTGYITIPNTGSYQFGTLADDGSRVSVNGSSVMDNWTGPCCSLVYGSSTALNAGTYPITVDMYDSGGAAQMNLYVKETVGGVTTEQIVPSSWLSPKAQVLPSGWDLGIDPDGDVSYDHLIANQNNAILTDSSGDTHEYIWTGIPGATSGGYAPPANESGNLVRNSDGTFTFQDSDGKVYQFDTEGTLTSVSTVADDLHPAALQYTYSGSPAKITQITDGVDSARWMKVYYSGDSNCGSAPSGFDASAPSNMICAAITNDGRATYFYYLNGNLARIAKPGNELTDFQYDTLGRITGIRDSVANDALIYAVRNDDSTLLTQISYDELGRAISVTSPDPIGGAGNEIGQTIEYLPGTGDGTGGTTLGVTREHVTGSSEPNGFTRQIGYDNLFRTVTDTDKANLTTSYVWNSTKDLLLSTTDPAGEESTTIYDDLDRPITSYGPAPSSWYDSTGVPLSSYANQVPETETGYDEGLQGLAVSWYHFNTSTMSMTGAPVWHTTGFPNNSGNSKKQVSSIYIDGDVPQNFSTGDSWAYVATGIVRFPETGTYTFDAYGTDGARVWFDDQLVIDNWSQNTVGHDDGSYAFNNVANMPHRIRIEYFHTGSPTTTSTFGWYPNGPGISDPNQSNLYTSPDYNLVTSSTINDSTYGDSTTTTNYGSTPEYGLPQSTTVDPTGLNLTTSYNYEAPGTGSYLRQTSQTLPGGETTSYSYYSATATADNPCTTGTTEAYHEGGMLDVTTNSDPDGPSLGGLGTTHENVYDDAGNIVATSQHGNWECMYYDARGRLTQAYYPSYIGYPAITVNYNYAVNDNPLVVSISDNTGTTTTSHDLLGRTVGYEDVKGVQTNTYYNNLGQITRVVGPLLTLYYGYNNVDRLIQIGTSSGGNQIASMTYDAYGRLATTSYTGSSSGISSVSRNDLNELTGLNWSTASGNISDTVTRSQSGKIATDYVSDLGVTKPTWNYTYDKAGRLTLATQGSDSYAYGFGTEDSSTCSSVYGNNPNAGKSSNRTSQTFDGTTTYYCYDGADKFIKSNDPYFKQSSYFDNDHLQAYMWGSGWANEIQFWYDAEGRTAEMQSGSNRVYYTYDVDNRIVGRNDNVSGSNTSFGYASDSSSTPDYVLDSSGSVITQYISLPGGALLTYTPGATGNAQKTYSLPDIQGDIIATLNASGTVTDTYTYDPFGTWPNDIPSNTVSGASFGWKGSSEKLEENTQYYNPITMGSRVYMSYIGRFNTTDPVSGGNANSYIYPQDPINDSDLSGEFSLGGLLKSIGNIVSSILPKSKPKPAPKPTVTAKASAGAANSLAIVAASSARAYSSPLAPKNIINFNNLKPQNSVINGYTPDGNTKSTTSKGAGSIMGGIKAAGRGCAESTAVSLAAAGSATMVSGGALALPSGAAVGGFCVGGAAWGLAKYLIFGDKDVPDNSYMYDIYDGLQ